MLDKKRLLALSIAAAFSTPAVVYATNGMNLEGYGPIATGMGGASMAYDNGTAAVMNNPATLGLADDGNRLDAALGFLGPNITVSDDVGGDADSDATAFYMPAVGWVRNQGPMAYGVGVFAQGGMGAMYEDDTFMSGGTNLDNRSEVGVMRIIAPFTYTLNKQVTVGGSVDYVRAGMDLKMMMSGAQMFSMMGMPSSLTGLPANYHGTMSGSMVDSMGSMTSDGTSPNVMYGLNYGHFDFSDGSPYSGEAQGSGLAFKLGGVFVVDDKLSLGATYHSETALGDLTGSAEVLFNALIDDNVLNGSWDPFTMTGAPAGTSTATDITLKGDITIEDFQWPSTMGFGAAYQATDKLFLAADVKIIKWSDVMSDFKMNFKASNNQDPGLAGGFAGQEIDAVMIQDWSDQTVIALGGAYAVTDQFTARLGYNTANNPVPEDYLNPLFPATVENHITMGAGYAINPASEVNFSLTSAMENVSKIKVDGNDTGMEVSHSQISWQLMYSHMF